jgi:NADH-quinone oxidoreductase subunit J
VNPSNNVSTIGAVLYTDFWLWMILASLILLVAMIGAIVLTLQHHNISNVRRQDIFGQLAATSTTSLTMNNNS